MADERPELGALKTVRTAGHTGDRQAEQRESEREQQVRRERHGPAKIAYLTAERDSTIV